MMIQFEGFELNNGLKVFVHTDSTSPTAAFNLCYNVGSRDENPHKTGFAHLFEHLMFGGSANIPEYDVPLQKVGAQNNAYTNTDLTNYYITLPTQNLETAFWIESDRMKALSFDPKVLDVQKSVVIEEFKQRYLNQPYGDIWLHLRPLSYEVHPYQWATIGKDISHIENATMDDVKDFFYGNYAPNNAVLTVAGNVSVKEIELLSKKWFSDIPNRKIKNRNLPKEPIQFKKRERHIEKKVPSDMIIMAYHMAEKYHSSYYDLDLFSDILGHGKSSVLHKELVEKSKSCTSVGAFQMATLDPGLFVVSAYLAPGVAYKSVEEEVSMLINQTIEKELNQEDLVRKKNQVKTDEGFSEVSVLSRATAITHAAIAGDVNYVNTNAEMFENISLESIAASVKSALKPENLSVLTYGG